ncbi:hypothetical protein, partial [Jatrophihabitans endophyticus]|uniref:hypothetical protein n=1 Tax=Jatrophihabitans endophyticus TaxID=1206085 RepID=UPI001A10A827
FIEQCIDILPYELRELRRPLLAEISGSTLGFSTPTFYTAVPEPRAAPAHGRTTLRDGLERDQLKGYIHGPLLIEDVRRRARELGFSGQLVVSPMFEVDKSVEPPAPPAWRRVCHYSVDYAVGQPSVNAMLDAARYCCKWITVRRVTQDVRASPRSGRTECGLRRSWTL